MSASSTLSRERVDAPDPQGARTPDPHRSELSPHAPGPRRIRAIDGLRGVAVSAVVLYHLFPDHLRGGYLGVDVFFVISGFVITLSLVHARRSTGGLGLGRFWIRRAQRLAPALATMLLAVCAAVAVVGPDVAGRLREQLLAAATFTGNWYQASTDISYFDRTDPPLLQHLWSLAVEEQFYLLWPLVLWGLLAWVRRPRTRVILTLAAAAASAGAMAWLSTPGEDPSRVYFGTDTHGFGLLLGATAALALPLLATANEPQRPGSIAATARAIGRLSLHPATAIIAALIVALAFVRLSDTRPEAYQGGIALVCGLTALILLGLTHRPGGPVRAVLTTHPLVWLGVRSYGIYLWHWPILVLLHAAAPHTEPLLMAALVVYLTLGVSALSWRFVERPVLRHGLRGAARRGWRAIGRDLPCRGTVVAVAVALLLAASAYAVREAPETGEVESLVVAGQEALAQSKPDQAPVEPPAVLADATPEEIGAQTLVIGDSVALASAPGLLAAMPGISVDAEVGRQLNEAPALVADLRDSGRLPAYVVVALGTNGDISTSDLRSILEEIGPDRRLVLVTAHGDREWMQRVNDKILAFAQRYDSVAVAPWHDTSAQVTDFAGDGIHPGSQGGTVFATTVLDALRTLR